MISGIQPTHSYVECRPIETAQAVATSHGIAPHFIPSPSIAPPTLTVPLTVKNELAIPRLRDAITSGIPIPKSWNALSPESFKVVDENGKPLSSQSIVTARWGGSPNDTSKPIKWILMTFQADVPASSTTHFKLMYGAPNPTKTNLKIASNTPSSMTIDTGVAQFKIDKTNFSLFDSVTVNGVVVTQSDENGIVLSAAKTEGSTINENVRYTSANRAPSAPPKVTIEESGPVRIVVKVEGALRHQNGNEALDYTTYLYFYAGQSYVRVIQTVGNHQQAMLKENGGYLVYNYGDPNSISFTDLSDVITLYQPKGPVSYRIPTDKGITGGTLQQLKVYQDSSGRPYWNRYSKGNHTHRDHPTGQDKSGHYPRLHSSVRFPGYQAHNGKHSITSGAQFSGWMDIADATKGIAVGLKEFWQQFPKALSASHDGKINIRLFPQDFSGTYNFRVGEEKTNEMLFFFHAGADGSTQSRHVMQSFNHPLMALAPAQWYPQSGAVPPYAPATGTLESRLGPYKERSDKEWWEYYNDRTLMADPLFRGDYFEPCHSLWLSSPGHPSCTDYYDFYGWSWYGNQPMEQEKIEQGESGPFNNKYDFGFGALLHYLRSQDSRWYEMGDAFAKHLEATMLHHVITNTGWDTERWYNAIFGHSQHNESGDANSVRNYLGPVGDTAFGGLTASLHYYLTGYPPSEQFVTDAANYAHAFFGNPKNKCNFANNPDWAPSREAANVLNLLTEGFRATGDRKYQKLAQQIIDDYAPDKHPWIKGPIKESATSLPTWIFGLYYTAMARYAELADEHGLTQESARVKKQLDAYLDWHMKFATRHPSGWTSSYYNYNVNGKNDPNETDRVNNWTLLLADAFAYGYRFTGRQDFLETAKRYFHTGARHPFSIDCDPTQYSSSKEAVNSAVFGHVYLGTIP